jgi:hypothetical protein
MDDVPTVRDMFVMFDDQQGLKLWSIGIDWVRDPGEMLGFARYFHVSIV